MFRVCRLNAFNCKRTMRCAMPSRKVSHHSIGEGENIIARPRKSLCTRSNAEQPGCP